MKGIPYMACCLGAALALSAAAAPIPPDHSLELWGSRKSVMFPHMPHANNACDACHHPVEGRENFDACGSVGCHDDLTAKQGVKSLHAVTHSKKKLAHTTCMACHSETVARQPERKRELTDCARSKCHP